MTPAEKILEAVDLNVEIAMHYGYEEQSRIAQEECAELIQAISKYHRNPNDETRAQVVEEIADVQVMLEQLQFLLDCFKEVREVEYAKLKRQKARIEEEQHEQKTVD